MAPIILCRGLGTRVAQQRAQALGRGIGVDEQSLG
jgi:hypothetical protein